MPYPPGVWAGPFGRFRAAEKGVSAVRGGALVMAAFPFAAGLWLCASLAPAAMASEKSQCAGMAGSRSLAQTAAISKAP